MAAMASTTGATADLKVEVPRARPRIIGVLDCDVHKNFPEHLGFQYYGDRVEQWLCAEPGDGAGSWEWTQFRVNCPSPQLPTLAQVESGFDGFVIPGSEANVTDDRPWIEPLCAVLRHAHAHNKALFGICFGHQIIAHALGGLVGPQPPFNFTVDELEEVDSAAAAALGLPATPTAGGLTPGPDETAAVPLKLYKAHGFQVLRPPRGAVVVWRSRRTPVEAFHIGATVLGFQGHPEFTRGVMLAILPHVRGIMDPLEVPRAEAALAGSPAAGDDDSAAAARPKPDTQQIRRLALRLLRAGSLFEES
mmetsp:Transcript_57528/g.130349  ORF Transcript_57528/g.130349 Transcript_57528/m.130349 type:complete len:306 (-) Transcript_57528:137-1054(-)|eukprot:CAMPEP_0172624768 /NCGR_PEP_ID=MMETSP1068-20121228/139072_1 /TAXON_ID=35684 /ORGANISM="Pseudopedinella elastica, Strain CCMP716" /LENGTH=305 /DNA_ID=CAMNT_0013433833 /DNA_START=239 /DNA_END=1156 /DNA_ORIENTATION=-